MSATTTKSAPAAKPASAAKPVPAAKPASAKVPKDGYLVLTTDNPCREGTGRAKRWALLIRFAGVEGGRAKLDEALQKGDFSVRASAMLNWCVKAGHVKT